MYVLTACTCSLLLHTKPPLQKARHPQSHPRPKRKKSPHPHFVGKHHRTPLCLIQRSKFTPPSCGSADHKHAMTFNTRRQKLDQSCKYSYSHLARREYGEKNRLRARARVVRARSGLGLECVFTFSQPRDGGDSTVEKGRRDRISTLHILETPNIDSCLAEGISASVHLLYCIVPTGLALQAGIYRLCSSLRCLCLYPASPVLASFLPKTRAPRFLEQVSEARRTTAAQIQTRSPALEEQRPNRHCLRNTKTTYSIPPSDPSEAPPPKQDSRKSGHEIPSQAGRA